MGYSVVVFDYHCMKLYENSLSEHIVYVCSEKRKKEKQIYINEWMNECLEQYEGEELFKYRNFGQNHRAV